MPSRRVAVAMICSLLALLGLLLPRLDGGLRFAGAPTPTGGGARSTPSSSSASHAEARSPLDDAARAWERFLTRHPDYDPLAEFLLVAPLGLPPSDPDLDRALELVEPLALDPKRADRVTVALLLARVLQARRDERAHQVLRGFLPRLAEYPRDDPRVVEALLLCFDAALTPPREWRDRTPANGTIRSHTVEAVTNLAGSLAATDPDPARAAVWRVLYVCLLYHGGGPTGPPLQILRGVHRDALPPNEAWRWTYALSRLAERDGAWQDLPRIYAEGAASAPNDTVRLYFETRERQVQIEFMFH